jgi:uncharacterized membrane protein
MSGKKNSKPLIVRKLSGVGWTLNPSHPVTWAVLAGLLVITLYHIFSQ